jgi:hypothetical protein
VKFTAAEERCIAFRGLLGISVLEWTRLAFGNELLMRGERREGSAVCPDCQRFTYGALLNGEGEGTVYRESIRGWVLLNGWEESPTHAMIIKYCGVHQ